MISRVELHPPVPAAGATPWIRAHARRTLGALGHFAEIFNVYSVGDSGDGCEVIEFTTPSVQGRVAWTAKLVYRDGRRCVICTSGWAS